ncbi:MAG: acyl carrier protein [Rhodobacteraceae bacterium]|nr:acyl carrier protein [Paracoccaceae bacterium]
MAEAIRQKVLEIIARQAMLEVDDISSETTLTDIGIDSLGLVEAVFAIEEHFDISIPFNANQPDATGFDTTSISAMIATIEALIAAKKT